MMDFVLKEIKPRKLWIATAFFTLFSFMVHSVGAMLAMGYYTMPQYLAVWSKIMMPSAGPPPLGFTVLSLLFGFITAYFFCIVYGIMRPVFKLESQMQAGAMYGLAIFIISGFSGTLSLYLLVNVPIELLAAWAVEGLIINVLGGAIVARLLQNKF
jgi:hypothetical protein